MASDTAPPPRAPVHGDLGENGGVSDGFGGSERDMSNLLQARLGNGIGSLHRSGSAPPNFADDLEGMLGGMNPLGANWGGAAPAPASGNGGWKQGQQVPPRSPSSMKDRDDALSDPAYVEYYYNQKNLNPRLPPPRTASANGGRDNLWQNKPETMPESHGSMGNLYNNPDPPFQQKTADGSQADPWASEPGKGLMGLPTLATRPKSLFSEKPAPAAQQTWQQQDGEYINSSSPVFGHPSSPFAPAPQRPIGTRDDGSLLLERNSRTSRAARSNGLGSFGSAPGTPTKRSMESVSIDSLLHEDLGRRLSVLSREGTSSLSTSPPDMIARHGSLNLGEHIKDNSQPVTPTMGQPTAFDHHMQARNYQELERLARSQHDDPSSIRHPHSRSDSPLRKSPNQTPPQMSPPRESSVMSAPQSPRMQQASAADLLPDSMYGPAAGDMGLGGQPDYGVAMSAAIASAGGEMPQFPTSLSPGPMPPQGIPGFQAAQQQQMQQMQQQMQAQAQAAATMSMMYGQPGGMQAAALAQAAALGMGGYPGMGMGLPPFPNPALLMAQAGMYGQGGGLPRSPAAPFPTPAGLPPEYAAYHQRMMEMYASMAQGANPQAGNPSAAMAAAAAAMAAANDPAMANMAAAYAAAAANMPPPPHSGPHPGSGKTSPEPPMDASSHSNEERGRPGRGGGGGGGGKDGGRRGRRGEGRESGGDDNGHSCPLLEQLKGNKAKKIELQDIVGSVMEFCTDQHGSRFIQLKLETSTGSDTAAVFEEVLPQAISLMTDVFGNYVVQKFFEHGTAEQRERLANTLDTNILSLSLQMYGCRVVQKALETLSLDRQRAIVAELNGHVMRCVRDQNGNHVIQKCIECVPTGEVAFMIDSFKGQVVMLSAHPYGCRVIQRVLEHCQDKERVRCVMTEVLSSVCQLAQDQYGNYVVQHVLERGAPSDRTTIISQLAGQIVEMSQHKFASNVVEKCLQHGSHSDRQILISEIMGRSEENGPLQMMMKDQFGNYVVQKLLEVCDDHQREALLTRIKQHLHNLKKYTYGKHIVARVEKLITNTQRLIRNSSASLAHGAESSAQPEQPPPGLSLPVPGPPEDADPAVEDSTSPTA